MWPGGELYIDEAEAVKDALGAQGFSNRWLLRPSVLKDVVRFTKNFGTSTGDLTDAKTQKRGGTFVVVDNKVVYVHRETERFDNGDANELLQAVLQGGGGGRGGARSGAAAITMAARADASAETCADQTTGTTACVD